MPKLPPDLEHTLDASLREAWNLLFATAQPSEAVCWQVSALCNQVINGNPSSAAAWLLKAQVLLQLGDAQAAASAVEMALKHGREHPECHYVHAVTLLRLGQHQDALRAVTRGLHRAHPQVSDWVLEGLCYQRAVILEALGRKDDALETLEAGLSRFPNSKLFKSLLPRRRSHLHNE